MTGLHPAFNFVLKSKKIEYFIMYAGHGMYYSIINIIYLISVSLSEVTIIIGGIEVSVLDYIKHNFNSTNSSI